jgi:hypothetical protein
MRRLISRQRIAAIALVVAIGACVAAVAAIGRGDPRGNGPPARAAASKRSANGPQGRGAASNRPARGHGDLAIAADYLGLSTAQLRSELRGGRTLAQVADGTSGKSSSGLVHALVSAKIPRLTARVVAEVNSVRGNGGARAGGGPGAARYLGLSPVQLRAALRAGRSLAQIADATPGKSASGLIDALVASRKAGLERAAAAGRLSQAKEQAMLSKLRTRVTARVNRAHSQRP